MRAIELFGHWEEVRTDLFRAVDTLSDDELRFVPRPGLWSMGEVLCHLAGCEDGWLRCLCGEPFADVNYDAADYATVEAVRRLLLDVHERTLATLRELDVDDLSRQALTLWGSPTTVGWIIWHVLEHEVHHRGEIFLMIGLLGREAPDI